MNEPTGDTNRGGSVPVSPQFAGAGAAAGHFGRSDSQPAGAGSHEMRRGMPEELLKDSVRSYRRWKGINDFLRVLLPMLTVLSTVVACAAGIWLAKEVAFANAALQLIISGTVKFKQMAAKRLEVTDRYLRSIMDLPPLQTQPSFTLSPPRSE